MKHIASALITLSIFLLAATGSATTHSGRQTPSSAPQSIEVTRNLTSMPLAFTEATFLLKASNYNYRFVQTQLGHASIRTTQVYASILESEGCKALERIYK